MMSWLGLTDHDLAANREGHLSPTQIARLRAKAITIAVGYGLLAVIFGGFAIYAPHDSANILWDLGAGLCFVVMIGVLIFKCGQIVRDLMSAKVVSVEGKIAVRVMESRSPRYKVEIGAVELEIPLQAYQGLKDGERYCVYYAPKSRTILAIARAT